MSNKRVCDRCNAVFDEQDRALNNRWSRWELPDRKFMDFCGKCTRVIHFLYQLRMVDVYKILPTGLFPVSPSGDPLTTKEELEKAKR